MELSGLSSLNGVIDTPRPDRLPSRAGGRLRSIALIGVDGSGKTTQALRLAETLTAQGIPARYRRNAGGRRWLGRCARRLGRPNAEALLGRMGLLIVESVLRWLAIARSVLGSVLDRRVAVLDRYTVCQYASLRAHGARRWEPLARWVYAVFPRPDVTFLLTVDPAEAWRRIEARGTDSETLEFLTASDAAYRSLPEADEFVIIDGNAAPEEVERAIREELRRWLPLRQPIMAG